MTYQVKLDIFEGPFDLLLHLIAKRELDIYEISLAAITEEYLAHLKRMTDLDLEVATEFLVVAAALIEIKAARLLPGPPADDEVALAVSERDLLIARLLQYRAFKDAAARLRGLLDSCAGFAPREAGPGEEFAHLCPDLLARVSPEKLRDIAVRALAPKPRFVVDLTHIAPIRFSVAEAIARVQEILRSRPRSSFRDLSDDCGSRIEVIVRFLAVLELVKRGVADVSQARTFGDIVVELLPGGDTAGPVDEYEGLADVRAAECVREAP
ncbi:MAG: segregation/condensation protein A [Acidobacteria bacterium]|nr:segregation/condensation protein A [Acidobacteriota bacterium]